MQLHVFGQVRAWRLMLRGQRVVCTCAVPSKQPAPAVVAVRCFGQALGNQRLALQAASRLIFMTTINRQGRGRAITHMQGRSPCDQGRRLQHRAVPLTLR